MAAIHFLQEQIFNNLTKAVSDVLSSSLIVIDVVVYLSWHWYWNDVIWGKLTRLESSRGPVQWVVRIQGQAEKSQTGPPHLEELDSAAVVVVVMVKITPRYEITLNDIVL